MENEKTLSILLVYDSVDDANRLVSLLRNANYDVDPHYAADAQELNKRIQERRWDLTLAQFDATSVPARNVVHQIRRLNKDIPVIFILREYDPAEIVEALKIGGADAVPEDEDQLFIHAMARTLQHLEHRRKLRYWQRRFSESEDRFENLILSSRDGIAIIQEGTYVHVNNTFARYFGHLDADDMMLMPVVDSIAGRSQQAFRKYLKPLDPNDAWDTEVIRFDAVNAEGGEFPVQATVSQIDFHGEPALQFLIKKEFIAATGEGEPDAAAHSTQQPETADAAKIRPQEMVEAINSSIRRAAKTGEDVLLFYINVDHYEATQQKLGIGVTENGLVQLAHYIESMIPDKITFGRLREETFVAIIASRDPERGLALGNRIVSEVSAQIFNTSEGSFTCTLSVGITPIGEATASADEALGHCQKTVAELQKSDNSDRLGNAARFYEPVFDLGSSEISEADVLRIGRQLIKKNLTTVAFQPVISLHGSRDELYDAHIGIDPSLFAEAEIPSDFIANVFRTDIGRDLDRLVLGEALKNLQAKKQTAPHTRLCFHISQATLTDEKFVSWLQATLERHQLSPADVVVEMREIDIGHNLGAAARMLERLKNLGTETSLTHYGLSINPTTIFNRISVDYVKVDASIAGKAQADKAALESLKNLVVELKKHNHRIVVPHIESASIIPTLWQAGVEFLQGNYIQAPREHMDFDFSEE